MNEHSEAFKVQAEAMGDLVKSGYRLFASQRLELDFDERCSPMADRQDLAKKMSRCKDPSLVPEEDMAIYTFRALTTMGNENDLLYFLPRIFELVVGSVVDKHAEWNCHDTIWLKKVAALTDGDHLSDEQISFVTSFLDALWILTLLVCEKRWYLILDFLKDLEVSYSTERFLDAWLAAEVVEAVDPLAYFATDGLDFGDSSVRSLKQPFEEWLRSDPVLEKILPSL